MSRQVFRDVEEALAREVRRITFDNARTLSRTVLQDTFDPFTGDLISLPVEANFYDSSADTKSIQYPHIFVKLMKSREDRFTGRVVPQYGRWITTPIASSPLAYEIVLSAPDGSIAIVGNELKTSIFQIKKIQPGYLLRLLSGNNIGTYQVSSIVASNSGPHSIFVSSNISTSLPSASFTALTRVLTFSSSVDLNTIKIGDNFIDSSSTSFSITGIDINTNSIVLGSIGTPVLTSGGNITRTGNVFQNIDPSLVNFIVMDPSKPVQAQGLQGPDQAHSLYSGVSPSVPLDTYYLVRIDSKERDTHIDIINRVWEEFNPPRTGLPVIERSALSAEQALTADITTGGSPNVFVADNSKYNINDSVFIFDDFLPTKKVVDETFERPFESRVIGKVSTNQLILADIVPDTFVLTNNAKIVSNAEFNLLMFHFVDHVTKDVESSQYWVHEFIFWVQIFVDRLGEANRTTAITNISTPVGIIDGNIII